MNGSSQQISPQGVSTYDSFGDFTPDIDYLDDDNTFDFEDADLGGEMIGALPGSESGPAQHDKRKSPDDGTETSDAKRQETGGEKGAKKPGRKPLTNEPTTKRKAQNRAAQRAFRDRKEKHLKDLETKVEELTKSEEVNKQENDLLKAKIQRLQSELKDYRKRLSLTSGLGQSPPLTAKSYSSDKLAGAQFSFDFSKFGEKIEAPINGDYSPSSGANLKRSSTTPATSLPTPNSLGGGSISDSIGNGPGLKQQHYQQSPASMSQDQFFGNNLMAGNGFQTNDLDQGFASTLAPNPTADAISDLFSPSILKSGSIDGNNFFGGVSSAPTDTTNSGGETTAGLNRVFHFNSGSNASDSASPGSASSLGQWNTHNSSCGTSPEPSQASPGTKTKSTPSFNNSTNYLQTLTEDPSMLQNPDFSLNNFQNFNVPTTQKFDPVLFGDYRDSTETFYDGELSNGFFDDSMNNFDFSSPSNLFGILQSPQPVSTPASRSTGVPSQQLMAQTEKARDGDDEVVGASEKKAYETGEMISCNNIWNQLQSNPEYQSGKFDLDSLCTELRVKARCSESGVLVSKDHVDAALKKLSNKTQPEDDSRSIMFEQKSWDKVIEKMSSGGSKN